MGRLVETVDLRDEGMGTAHPLVELRGVSKRFGGVRAVSGVSLSVRAGSVHALVGENGAGKSTLAKIIGGVHEPDDGQVVIDGGPVQLRAPRYALALGISTIAQELALVPALSVIKNVFLGQEPRRAGVLRERPLRALFDELNTTSGFALDPDSRVGTLRPAEQQKVEILRAIARRSRLVIMDEPTASLTGDETERLLGIIEQLTVTGTTIVLVSHFLDEVLRVSDDVSVMRDGQLVRTSLSSEETEASLVSAMIGRDMELAFPERIPVPADAPTVLRAAGLARRGAIDNVSLDIRAGEIVGLAGLVGSGRSEIARAIFGADSLDRGEVWINDRLVRTRSPRDAERAGIAMLPESRKDQGLIMRRPIRENVTMAAIGDFSVSGIVDVSRERRAASAGCADVDVRARSIETPVINLSGGNQQKVMFAKWLVRKPKVLIVDEPTRGVDVGAKRQIHELIVRLAAEGIGVLLISSDIEEVLGLAHRTLVLRSGRVVAEFTADRANKEAVMAAAFQTVRRAPGGSPA